ncbi:MAG: outer membrane protein assembly factor BamD, partial [Alphaproteobacteria bacterium]|nr:outer membrane protein assembly factor BamD [Alphaproteobacteria bacterium]
MKKIFYISLTVIASSMLIVACSSKNDFDEAYEERPVSELYNEAMDFLKEKKYEKAVSAFDEVERQH